jgi:predicted DNA-binding protein
MELREGNNMLAVKINDPLISKHLAKQSRLLGKSRQAIVKDILHKQAEDAEDYAAAVAASADPSPSRPIGELWRKLDLED